MRGGRGCRGTGCRDPAREPPSGRQFEWVPQGGGGGGGGGHSLRSSILRRLLLTLLPTGASSSAK